MRMKAAETPEASALKEDRFYTNDVIAEIATLPLFLQEKHAERWLSEVVAKLALRGCGREEVAWLLSLPLDTINEDLPPSAGEDQLGTCLLELEFLPRGAGCGIFGSNSSPQLNDRRCTLCRDLSGAETHALVLVEARGGDPPGEYEDAMLIARKNLRFDSIPSRQLTLEGSQWPNVGNRPIPEEEVQAPASLLGQAVPGPPALSSAEALRWLEACVARLRVKACPREEIAFLLSLPAEKLSSALPALGTDHVGALLQDIPFIPQGARCRVEGSTSNAKLNGLEGQLTESCPSHSTHAKLLLPGEGEVMIHRKNLRLLALGSLKSEAVGKTSGGLCAWLGLRCCDEVRAAAPQRLGHRQDGASMAEELRRLGDMHTSGRLSDVEFHVAKTKLLAAQS